MSNFSPYSRSTPQPTNLQLLASALSTIPGSNAIRVRNGQTPTKTDAMQSLLYTLSLLTASERQTRRIPNSGRKSQRRNSAA